MNRETCDKTGCERPCEGAMGIEFYPTKALLEFYGTDKYLTRVVMGLEVCLEHAESEDPKLLLGENFENVCRTIEVGGTTVDRNACKCVLVDFQDPDYLLLTKDRT